MENLEFGYKESFVILESALKEITVRLDNMRNYLKANDMRDPIDHFISRIKTEKSMREKLIRKGLPLNIDSALNKIHDAVGVRIICSYINDIYDVIEMIKKQDDIKIISEKDYIKNPKPNGYRSYHLIVSVNVYVGDKKAETFIEIQLRTIAMDCWASLEHMIKYKKDIKNQNLIVSELKRCADEIASCDITMQTIHDLIKNEK